MPFPVIPVAMAALSIGKSIAEGSAAKRSARTAASAHANIPEVDPGIRRQLQDIQLRGRYAEMGQSRMLNVKRHNINESAMEGDRAITNSSGSAPGAVQQGILRNRLGAGRNLAIAGAETESQVPQYLSAATPLVSDIADRTLSLRSYLRDTHAMQSAQHRLNANNLLMGGMALMGNLDPSMSGGGGKNRDGFSPPLGTGAAGDQNMDLNGAPTQEWDFTKPPGGVFDTDPSYA